MVPFSLEGRRSQSPSQNLYMLFIKDNTAPLPGADLLRKTWHGSRYPGLGRGNLEGDGQADDNGFNRTGG